VKKPANKKYFYYMFNLSSSDTKQGSISPTFYQQLLCAQIPKAQKDSQVISVFLRFWDLFTQKLLLEH
jgi:hypothetical protein